MSSPASNCVFPVLFHSFFDDFSEFSLLNPLFLSFFCVDPLTSILITLNLYRLMQIMGPQRLLYPRPPKKQQRTSTPSQTTTSRRECTSWEENCLSLDAISTSMALLRRMQRRWSRTTPSTRTSTASTSITARAREGTIVLETFICSFTSYVVKKANQDRLLMKEDLETGTIILGVFDGHGEHGHCVSEVVHSLFFPFLECQWGIL